MLACHFHENKTNHCWTDWLHEIQYKLNTSLHETTKATPYQLCFGQPPHSSSFPGATTGSIMEEAVSDILDDIEEEVTDISAMQGWQVAQKKMCQLLVFLRKEEVMIQIQIPSKMKQTQHNA